MSDLQASKKTSKPFCSLAYLAKSTIAINGSNDVRTVNGYSSCNNNNTINKTSQSLNNNNNNNITNGNNNNCQQQPSTPNMAVTAKVNERGSPSLPTGASTTINGHHTQNTETITNTKSNLHYNSNNNKNTCPDYKHNMNGHSTVADVFGIINEEDMETCCDQVDGSSMPNDLRRPWEVGTNGGAYCKRIPPSLMTANSYQHLSNGLPSLSKLNSLDCWDYTIELECLNGPQGNQSAFFFFVNICNNL